MKEIKKLIFNLITITIVILCSIGIYGIITAPKEKVKADQKQLQAELERNRRQLNKVNAQPKDTDKGTSTVHKQDNVTAIGDSVMLGAAPSIQSKIPNCVVDAKESRQLTDCLSIVQSLNSQGKLGNKVIIALGTNGAFNKSDGQKLLNYLGKNRKIYWVTAYGKTLSWQNDVNNTIRSLASSNRNVIIIDWSSIISSNPSWLYSDGIHLNTDGQAGYADYLAKEVL